MFNCGISRFRPPDDQPWDDGDECWHCAGCFLGRGNLETEHLQETGDIFGVTLGFQPRKMGISRLPIGSMYGIYANIGGIILMVNVIIYTIHGSYGLWPWKRWTSPIHSEAKLRWPESLWWGDQHVFLWKKEIWPTRDKRDSILKKETVALIVAKLMVYFLNHSGWGMNVSTDWAGHASSN